jgi:3-oxoacyl-[acyl-carrier protein] reductase
MDTRYTSLDGKVAIVTGGNHGIGAATARALAVQGCAVLVQFLRLRPADDGAGDAYHAARAQSADDVIDTIHTAGGRAQAIECDLAQPAAIEAMFNAAERAFGQVDILVNNAAHWQADSLTPGGSGGHGANAWPPRSPELVPASLDAHLAVNARAIALAMVEFARRLRARGGNWGRVVNVSTDASACFPEEVSYGASKAALESLSRSAAMEFGKFGITVNIVSPGGTQTGWITPEFAETVKQQNPLGRIGQPEDIADVIVFLASDQGRWVNGQLIRANGGAKV